MKILVVPDSYKGSLTSEKVAQTIKKSIEDNSDNIVEAMPLSDGGDGFTNTMEMICNGKKIVTKCHNIYGQEIDGHIVVFGNTAVIDSATASGLQKRKMVMQASSYGTGELIKLAIEQGYKQIILGIGGTGCCDGGMGALAALGAKFYDENQNIMSNPKANDLNYIFGVDFKNCPKDIDITYACDVENEYFGKNGAAYVFAAQKGARKTDIEELDNGFQRLNAFFKNNISALKGGGAGGGICGGLFAVLGGKIMSGFDVIFQNSNLEEKIKEADVVITGEGKTDNQTLMGKLPYKISELCKKSNTRCVIISGAIDNVNLGDAGISLVDDGITPQEAMSNAEEILYKKVKNNLEIILN